MFNLSLSEAQLLRILTGFFGEDRVIPLMSVLAVCGGELPADYSVHGFDLRRWAKTSKCLFTVIDDDDRPRVVFEFFSGFSDIIEADVVEHQRYLKPLLEHVGVRYITISDEEFDEILNPVGNLDFVSFLQGHIAEGTD